MAQPDPNARHVEPAVFGTAMEGLFTRGLGPKLNAAAKSEMRAIGIDADRPFLPAYSIEQWVQALEIAARNAFPGASADAAYFQLGQEFMNGLQRTLVGKALFAFGQVIGPKRMLGRMTSAFRSSNNYVESVLLDEGGTLVLETRVIPVLLPKMAGRPAAPPHYMRGILFQCLTLGGARKVNVELISHDMVQRVSRYRLEFEV